MYEYIMFTIVHSMVHIYLYIYIYVIYTRYIIALSFQWLKYRSYIHMSTHIISIFLKLINFVGLFSINYLKLYLKNFGIKINTDKFRKK